MAQQDITSPINFGGGYVTRFNTGLGFNSSPSTVDLDVVVPNDGVFQSGLLTPGNISGISVGALNFVGIVQSWQKSKSRAGIIHSVKMADPRIIFNDITVIMNGTGPQLPIAPYLTNGSGVYNIINVYNVFGNDYDADYNENGMSWNNIKYALENTSGYVNCYNKRFYLDFDSGWDAPQYLRFNGQTTSLSSLLDTVSKNLGIEYYAYIDPTTYVPSTGVVSTIVIKSINRASDATVATDIDTLITNYENSGLMMSYVRGRELRSGPTQIIVQGSNYNYMYNTTASFPCFGRLGNGSLLTLANNASTPSEFGAYSPDAAERFKGIVVLDDIQTEDPNEFIGLPQLAINGKTRYMTGGTYPPTVFDDVINNEPYGYLPTENIMRAALFSRESWETILYLEDPTFASAIGISGLFIKPTGDLVRLAGFRVNSQGGVKENKDGFRFESMGTGVLTRSERQEALISLVYDKTRDIADNYYGKQFVVPLPLGTISVGSTTGYGTSLNYRHGYRVVDAAWHENANANLRKSGSEKLRNDDGRHKAHVVIDKITDLLAPNDVILNAGSNFVYGTDTLVYNYSNIDESNYILSGAVMYMAINVEQDSTNSSRAIVTLDSPLLFADFDDPKIPTSFIHFWRCVGLPDSAIDILAKWPEYYDMFGMAPQRVVYFPETYIPIENQLKQYGPFIAGTGTPGGTAYIVDDSLNPWTYGGFAGMNMAGTGIAYAALADKHIIDNTSFTLAGLPLYNLGDIIGDSSNINQLSLNFGADGLSTNYAAQTYANPFVKYVRQADRNLQRVQYLTNKFEKDKINFQDYLNEAKKTLAGKMLIGGDKSSLSNKGIKDSWPHNAINWTLS